MAFVYPDIPQEATPTSTNSEYVNWDWDVDSWDVDKEWSFIYGIKPLSYKDMHLVRWTCYEDEEPKAKKKPWYREVEFKNKKKRKYV